MTKKTMTFEQKLIAVQTNLKAPKGQTNSHGKYKYRSCEDILEAVKPLLGEHGLHMTITDDIHHIGDRYYLKATVRVSEGENERVVTGYAREMLNRKGMDESQITGAASSYARKYALNGMFLIDDTKDADTMEPPQKKKEPLSDDRFDKFLVGLSEANDNATVDKLVKMVETFELTKEQSTKAEHEVAKRRREIKSNEEIIKAENMMI